MMCFYDPAKFSPRVVYRVEEGTTLVPGRIIYLRIEPDLDDLIGMDDPTPYPLAWWDDLITAPFIEAFERWLS